MSLFIVAADVHLIDLKTRLPFKYGIATMTEAPHAFVRVTARIDGEEFTGVAADVLPPKWFTKIADKPLGTEIDEMLDVIEHAVSLSVNRSAESVFDFWQQHTTEQFAWGSQQQYPPLLSNFGTSLVERAVIECAAKSAKQPFWRLLQSNALGIRLCEIDPQFDGLEPADLLPNLPASRVIARHTVGMADLITAEEIGDGERLSDGLPQALTECIERYGLRHLKLKVSGAIAHDVQRLARIAEVTSSLPTDFEFTLDGNEQFRELAAFQDYWRALTATPALESIFSRLMFVEQPFHREVALSPDVLAGLRTWHGRPRMIIDESDAELDSLPSALQLGYHGTSHKNCKGVFKSIINRCRLELLRRSQVADVVMSGEDLANVGPVALLQDLAVSAALGVTSIERNGHHYFAGLSAFPQSVQQSVLDAHADLYQASAHGWPTLAIQDGQLAIESANSAPFGLGFELDVEQFIPLAKWRAQQ